MKRNHEQVFTCGAASVYMTSEGAVYTQVDKAMSALKGIAAKVAHRR